MGGGGGGIKKYTDTYVYVHTRRKWWQQEQPSRKKEKKRKKITYIKNFFCSLFSSSSASFTACFSFAVSSLVKWKKSRREPAKAESRQAEIQEK